MTPAPERAPEVAASTKAAIAVFLVGLLGLPVWWLLGLTTVVPLLMAVPLGWDLWQRRQVQLPPGAGWWLLFLAWVVIGAGVLWAAAPSAADDDGAARLLVFGYRLAWYLSCTVVLLWVGNTSRRQLPDRWVHGALAWVFVVATCGGLLGMLAPDLAVPTLAEQVLPGGLRSNSFVASLISAETADVQSVLGDPQPRPKAPFAFTNTWGSVMALSLVFFVAFLARARGRVRWLGLPVLAIAAVPIAFSLNRALWMALALGCAGVLVLLAARRRVVVLAAIGAVLVLGGMVAAQSPLGDVYSARIENPHSNERRSQLVSATVDSVTNGSPVVGFGSTRDVQGSFFSIAGGATPDCPACGVPPLGTQGQLWLVLFSQGWLGLLFFLVFLVLALSRTWRCRTTNETVATFAVGFYLLQLPVYDTLGMPLLIVMVAIALAWRERREDPAAPPAHHLRAPRPREVAVVGLLCAVGAGAGVAVSGSTPPEETSTVALALTPTPTYLDVGETARSLDSEIDDPLAEPAVSTIDTEAALMRSQSALRRAGSAVDLSPEELRSAVSVAAPPLSQVVELTARVPAAEDAPAVADAVARSYLVERRGLLERQRADLLNQIDKKLRAIGPGDPARGTVRAYLRAAHDHLSTHRPGVGQVIRRTPGTAVPPARAVPITSGLALGLLAGVGLVRLTHRRRVGP